MYYINAMCHINVLFDNYCNFWNKHIMHTMHIVHIICIIHCIIHCILCFKLSKGSDYISTNFQLSVTPRSDVVGAKLPKTLENHHEAAPDRQTQCCCCLRIERLLFKLSTAPMFLQWHLLITFLPMLTWQKMDFSNFTSLWL